MEKDELYHAGWTHRKFYNPKVSSKNDSKHPRIDDPIERMAMEQAQAELNITVQNGVTQAGAEHTGGLSHQQEQAVDPQGDEPKQLA